MIPRTETKVWRPAGFPGIEIEKDVHLSGKLYQHKKMMLYSDLTVHVQGRAEGYAYFDKTYHYHDQVEGLVFLQNAGDVFEVDCAFTELMSSWTVRLLHEQQMEVLSALGLNAQPFHFDQTSLTGEVRRRLARNIECTANSFEQPASTLERESRLLELLTFALNHCAESPLPSTTPGQEHRAVKCVKEVLETHPERDNTLSELAALTGLNQYYLYEIFRRDVGLSPHSYQTSVRIHRVKQLLVAGTPIAQAAVALGFSDQSHLTHTFKKYTQVTPGRFRRDSLKSS